jgi:hypothetical protein
MEMYPGNGPKQPVIRDAIGGLKERGNIVGRTIHVADKGLNCAQNIASAKKAGDGYLFSKSVKMLPAKEKDWVLLENDYTIVRNNKGKELYRHKSCVDMFQFKILGNVCSPSGSFFIFTNHPSGVVYTATAKRAPCSLSGKTRYRILVCFCTQSA